MLYIHSTLVKGVLLAGFGLKTLEVGAAPTLGRRVAPGSSEIPIPALSAHEHEWYCKTDTRPLMGIDHQLSCGPAYRAYPSKTGKPLCSGIFSGPSYIACNTCVRVTCGEFDPLKYCYSSLIVTELPMHRQ